MAAKKSAPKPYVQTPLLWEQSLLPAPTTDHPQYSPTELQQATEQVYHLDHRGWWITPEDKLFLPQSSQWKVLKTLYQSYHLGIHKTLLLTSQLFEGIKLKDTCQNIIRGCEIC
jgi:hypothetical protein